MIPEESHEHFRPMDLHFARAMERWAGRKDALLFGASLLVSYRAGMGDACLDIAGAGGKNLAALVEGYEGEATLPHAERWAGALAASPVVGSPGEYRPLIMDGAGRLYLYRFWRYERVISETLAAMAAAAPEGVDRELLAGDLERYFPRGDDINWQRVAALTAATRRLCVVSGGPGTGKTTAVVRILAILIRQGIARGNAPSIAMAAPTGKASKRLQEAVSSAVEELALDGELRELPDEVFTLHRLLGIYPGSSRAARGPENPLPHDVVVVDEGSMADMALMSRLLLSLRSDARLILLGDRDQLASVEAGAVLGDLCDTGREHGRSRALVALAKELAGEDLPAGTEDRPLADSLVILRKSYRFGPESGIGALAAAIRDGDAAGAMRILGSDDFPDVTLGPIDALAEIVRDHAAARHARLTASSPAEAFGMLGENVLLCALRQGPFGVERVNRMAERALYGEGLIRGDSPWFPGRPVMVTRNDYSQKLFNGDTGVVLADPESGENRVFFPAMDVPYKRIIPSRLPPHESAYAVTVHKSQGSEFRRVTVVLPDRYSPVLTRELLYTAVTRARSAVVIVAPGDVLERCIAARIERASGLRDALWG